MILHEGGLARLLKHVSGARGHAIISAHRGSSSSRENRRATKKMGRALRRMGYGFKKVTGRGQEVDPATGKVRVSKERSFFVPGMKKKHAKRLGRAFKQDFVIHGRRGKASLHSTQSKTGHPVMRWKRAKPTAAQYDTQVGKKHYHYEASSQIAVNRRS